MKPRKSPYHVNNCDPRRYQVPDKAKWIALVFQMLIFSFLSWQVWKVATEPIPNPDSRGLGQSQPVYPSGVELHNNEGSKQ